MSNERPWDTLKPEPKTDKDVDTEGLSLSANEHFRSSSAVRPKDQKKTSSERKDPILDIRSQPAAKPEPRVTLDPLANVATSNSDEPKRIKPILGSLDTKPQSTEPTLERHDSNAPVIDREPTIDAKPISAAPTSSSVEEESSDKQQAATDKKTKRQSQRRNWPMRIASYLGICFAAAIIGWWAVTAFEGGITQLAEDLAVEPAADDASAAPADELSSPEADQAE